MCGDLGNVRRLEDCRRGRGGAAIAFRRATRPRERRTRDRYIESAAEIGPESTSHFPENIYYIPVSADVTGEQVEQQYVDLVQAVKSEVHIPVAVKLGPYFSSMANMAPQAGRYRGGGGFFFNRFYQPDYDLEALEVVPNLILSNSHELQLRLHWIAVLYGGIKADMALTGGVHCGHRRLCESHDGRNAGSHDDVGKTQAWHQLSRHHLHRTAGVDGATTGIRFH